MLFKSDFPLNRKLQGMLLGSIKQLDLNQTQFSTVWRLWWEPIQKCIAELGSLFRSKLDFKTSVQNFNSCWTIKCQTSVQNFNSCWTIKCQTSVQNFNSCWTIKYQTSVQNFNSCWTIKYQTSVQNFNSCWTIKCHTSVQNLIHVGQSNVSLQSKI